jgi:putative ABC transport system permease protein
MPLPFTHMDFVLRFTALGRPPPPPDRRPSAPTTMASPGYLELLGVPLRRGRTLTAADDADGAAPVAVVSESLARLHWPGEDPIGKRFTLGMGTVGRDGSSQPSPLWQVVGVVGDVRSDLARPAEPHVYVPFAQFPVPFLTAVMRTRTPAARTEEIRRAVMAVDVQQPLDEARTLDRMVAESVGPRRVNALLLALFAGLALLLAAVGIYGVMSYAVAQRTRELGIRMALGAQGGQVLAMLVRQGLRAAAAGLGLGVLAALPLTRLLASQLYGISATDPATFVALGAGLLVVALLASLVPARHATRVDPLVALRQD